VTADLSGYSVVVAPLLHLVKGDFAARVSAFVSQGGSFLTTALSGRVDEDDNAFLSDAPGAFGSLLGLRIDETDAQPPDVTNPVTFTGGGGGVAQARHVFEVLVPTDSALEVRGTYGADFYAGTPAVTRTARGDGSAWYVGTLLDDAGIAAVVRAVLEEHDLTGPLADEPGVEVAERVAPDGTRFAFLLHHGDVARTVPVPFDGTDLLSGRELHAGEPLELAPADVLLIRRD
jgi:beta-galactosidase